MNFEHSCWAVLKKLFVRRDYAEYELFYCPYFHVVLISSFRILGGTLYP